jgi:hypothetical protein
MLLQTTEWAVVCGHELSRVSPGIYTILDETWFVWVPSRYVTQDVYLPGTMSVMAARRFITVFVVYIAVQLRKSVGFNVRELSRAEQLIHDNLELIKPKVAGRLG